MHCWDSWEIRVSSEESLLKCKSSRGQLPDLKAVALTLKEESKRLGDLENKLKSSLIFLFIILYVITGNFIVAIQIRMVQTCFDVGKKMELLRRLFQIIFLKTKNRNLFWLFLKDHGSILKQNHFVTNNAFSRGHSKNSHFRFSME